MRRRTTWSALFLTTLLVGAACTAGGGDDVAPATIDASASHEPVTIEMWVPFAGREFDDLMKVFDGFEAEYPWITVDVTEGVDDDDKVLAAIRSGTPPDAVMSWSLDSIAKFCDTGAWQDLAPYMEQTDLDTAIFPEAVTRFTSYQGTECALPFLTDAMGLYYNVGMLEDAGYSEPPKTTDELVEMAKKLTVFNPDGSIKVAGFVPWFGYYEFTELEASILFDADWYNDDGSSAVATDEDWKAIFEWQKEFVDFYGADNLKKFVAGQGDEWSGANDFERGRVAMMLDGEWRTRFIEDNTPDLDYMTAPMPVPADKQDLYGVGRVGGTIIGIPKGSAHPAEAWLLVEYMGTDTDALVTGANGLGNVPTTFDSLESPDLEVTPQFQTFLDIFANPGSHYKDHAVIGSADQDLVATFGEKWQAGDETDLQGGLEAVSTQINDQLEQAGA